MPGAYGQNLDHEAYTIPHLRKLYEDLEQRVSQERLERAQLTIQGALDKSVAKLQKENDGLKNNTPE